MSDWTEAKAQLEARRAELAEELQDIEHRLDDEKPKDWEDQASERQGDEVLEALGTHDLSELRQIDAALARIEDGSYGDCVKCGEEIAPKRLAALPATPLCVKCAA
ncbi:MAG: TraR/DksA family transcriptional regulator [Silicimonas sp.]|nr:TraR/DksA family transcriptional regulator [Silicimonas sp.]